jgi:hypothetical protein
VGPDANATSLGDVSIQVGLTDPDRASDPASYEIAANNGPADALITELQLIGGLSNGQ